MQKLYDERIVPKNLAGNQKINDLAKDKVLKTFDDYKKNRTFTQGGKQIDIVDKWDEDYRIYKTIRSDADHNYNTGIAKVFMPIARRAVNVIESQASTALFTRDDYFSTEGVGDSRANDDMALRVYNILKYYSDEEDYVSNLELAIKQCLIYGFTAAEVTFYKEEYEHKVKREVEVNIVDEKTGEEQFIEINGQARPLKTKKIEIANEKVLIERPRIEVRDIYRLYINHNTNEPLSEDIVYRDSMSRQRLLTLAEQGVYNKEAVKSLVDMPAIYNQSRDADDGDSGEGKTYLDETSANKEADKYEVLRFQGLFSIKEDDKTVKKQYWIDIGERREVLRIIENPLYGQYKTFSVCDYDTMVSESYVDGIIEPIKGLQYEVNDKENQSLDAVSFNINAPWLMNRRSKIKKSDILMSRKMPQYVIETNDMAGLQKMGEQVNSTHLNNELARLTNMSDITTGATNVASGIPTGTQADRSGKALGILQMQGASQFSKFIKKFERKFMSDLLTKCWKLLSQFSNDIVPIYIERGQEGSKIKEVLNQNVAEIIGDYRVRVTSGSQYIKQRQEIEATLEFISIANSNDAFIRALDVVPMFQDIAKRMPYDMSKYVNPDNLYNAQRSQIEQLVQVVKKSTSDLKYLADENQRLAGVVAQTDRAQEVSRPVSEDIEYAQEQKEDKD